MISRECAAGKHKKCTGCDCQCRKGEWINWERVKKNG